MVAKNDQSIPEDIEALPQTVNFIYDGARLTPPEYVPALQQFANRLRQHHIDLPSVADQGWFSLKISPSLNRARV